MDTLYTYTGMVVVWAVIAVLAFIVSYLTFHLIKTMVKAVDFMRFHKTMSLRAKPDWKWAHNLPYTYFCAVRLMWSENGDSDTVIHGSGVRYTAFNWK